MPVPVAELIVSAHAALLLHTLTGGVQRNDSVNNVDQRRIESAGTDFSPGGSIVPSPARSSKQNILMHETAKLEQCNLADHVRSKLPRGNWWLCVRVLKAFLTLQGQVNLLFTLFFTS